MTFDLDLIQTRCEAAGAHCHRDEFLPGIDFLTICTPDLAVLVWPTSYTVSNDTIVTLGSVEMAVMEAIAGQRGDLREAA